MHGDTQAAERGNQRVQVLGCFLEDLLGERPLGDLAQLLF